MNTLFSPRKLAALFSAFLLAGCTLFTRRQDSASAPEQPKVFSYTTVAAFQYADDPAVLAPLEQEIASAGTDPAKVALVVSGLADVIANKDATFAGQQAAAQRLGQLLDAPSAERLLPLLEPLLVDPIRVNIARLALEPVGSATVDAAFLRALESPDRQVRIAIIQTLGNRRVAASVPKIAAFLKGPQDELFNAAAMALGKIGTREACAALLEYPSLPSPTALDASIECLAQSTNPASLEDLRNFYKSGFAAPQRARAWQILLEREPKMAVERLIGVLSGGDPYFKQVGLSAIAALSGKDLVAGLCRALPTFDTATQIAVLDALAQKHDPSAVPTVLALAKDAPAAVRLAALQCLGSLPGDRSVVLTLAQAACEQGEVAAAARKSLSLLNGSEVDAAVQEGCSDASPALRAVFLAEIGPRGMASGSPILLKARGDSDVGARAAALESIALISPSSDQAEVLAWSLGASESREVTRALRALSSVTLRDPDTLGRDRRIIEALDSGDAKVRLRLIPVLPRLGDEPALVCAARMARDPSSAVALAAVSVLSSWSGSSALPALVAAAESSPSAEAKRSAIQGAIATVERTRTLPKAEPSELVARLIAVSTDDAVRSKLVFLLSRGSGDAALAAARRLKSDPKLAADARDAEACILANRSWPPALTSSHAQAMLSSMVDADMKTAWHAPVATGMWIKADFGTSRPLRRVTLREEGWDNAFPERYEVYVSQNPADMGKPVARGEGETSRTVIALPEGTKGRYLMIKDLGAPGNGEWAIFELQVD